ncbi:hypothetical protein [Kribbella flavida]|uniref:hypothetical protein n=1 Tax=Kribbella flavida TaxID=182640 RepID=UPI0002EFBB63|nr:hypothetical protein [Kribbella flavida]
MRCGHGESSFTAAGLEMEEKHAIGTEWRLDVYHHVEANLHWALYQFLGNLCLTVYILRPRVSTS